MTNNTIVIVDDDANIRTLLTVNLAAQGFSIETAADGKEAIDKIRANPPWLIILDVMMPDDDGWEVCKYVRDDPDLEKVKIVMLTARDTERDKLIGRQVLKADEYLTKPFDIDVLLSKINALREM
jgi:two-component system alkaline phosphatase synthesis response regulator PhoP